MHNEPSAAIRGQFWRYALPSMFSQLLNSCFIIVDGLFIGQNLGDAGLAAINVAWPMVAFIQAVSLAVGTGGAVRLATAQGRGDEAEALTARGNAAGHAVEAAQSTIQRTRLEVRQKLLEARSQVMSLLSTLQIQGRQEALSARTRELYQQQYLDLGSRPLLDVLNAEQEVYQARFTQQQTLGQLHQLQLNCLYNTGQLRHAFDLDNRTIQTVEIQP